MGAHGTWQQTGGGGFDPMPIVVIIAALAVASGVASAVAAVAQLLLIAVAVVAMVVAVAAAVTVVLVVRHRHRHPQPVQTPQSVLEQRNAFRAKIGAPPLEERPVRQAIEAPQNHLHFHGVSAADVAAILREQGQR